MALKNVKIEGSWGDNMQVNLKARNFEMKIDQPAPMGEDTGATPLEYFFFALAGCIVTIGKIIAKQKRLDVRGINVEVEGGLNPEVLMGKCDTERAGFQNIKVFVEVDADMTEEEKKAFVAEIDSRCPISDNIENASDIVFEVK